MIEVMILDDHAIVRHGLKVLLQSTGDIHVVAETGDGLEAIRMAETIHPDVMIIDLMLPGIGGIEVTRQVTRARNKTKVVIYSMYDQEQYVQEAVTAGAMAFVLKGSDPEDLITAIRQVVEGHHYLCGPLADMAIDVYVRGGAAAKKDPYDSLTPRELEILNLAAQGYTNREISARLYISHRTVEIHRTNIIRKLGLRVPHISLARYALERGIVPSLYKGKESQSTATAEKVILKEDSFIEEDNEESEALEP